MILLPKRVAPIVEAAATKEGRYAMDTVRVYEYADEVRLVATNGRILAVLTVERKEPGAEYLRGFPAEREVFEYAVPADVWKKAWSPGTDELAFACDGRYGWICDGIAPLNFKLPLLSYPDWMSLLTTAAPRPVVVRLNPRYVKTIANLAGKVVEKGEERVTLRAPLDGAEFVIFQARGKGLALDGILMPLDKVGEPAFYHPGTQPEVVLLKQEERQADAQAEAQAEGQADGQAGPGGDIIPISEGKKRKKDARRR